MINIAVIGEEGMQKNIMNTSEDYFPHMKLILIILLHFKKYSFRKKMNYIALCNDRRQVRKAFQNNFTPFNLKNTLLTIEKGP